MTVIGSKEEPRLGSRFQFYSGVLVVRPEDTAEPDLLMVKKSDLQAVSFFLLDTFDNVPRYIIPDSAVISVLHELGQGEPSEIAAPLLLREKLRIAPQDKTPVEVLSQKAA